MHESFFKDPIYEDEKYLAWIRSLNCYICGGIGNPHHVTLDKNAKGTAIKTHDYDTINLCLAHHQEHDLAGQITFWKRYPLYPEQIIRKQMMLYIFINK
jgi:hypothetical protein